MSPWHLQLTQEDLDLFRQWFDNVQDVNPQYLTAKDYELAKRLYLALNMRVPHSILRGCGEKVGN